MTVDDAFRAHLDERSAGSLERLQEAIRREPTFNSQTPWHARANDLLTQGRHDDVIRLINQQMPGAFLCPDAHRMLSHAYEQIRDRERSRYEAYHADAAIDVILGSGDGTRERPWQVQRVVDEYAVLRHARIEPAGQRLIQSERREFDVHDCTDGTERWFELV